MDTRGVEIRAFATVKVDGHFETSFSWPRLTGGGTSGGEGRWKGLPV